MVQVRGYIFSPLLLSILRKVKAIVVTGKGAMFCGGAEITEPRGVFGGAAQGRSMVIEPGIAKLV